MIVVVLVSNSGEQSLLFNLSSQHAVVVVAVCFLHCVYALFIGDFSFK